MFDVGAALRSWGESGSEAMLVVGDDQRIKWASRGFTALVGYDAAQAIGEGLEVLTASRYAGEQRPSPVQLRRTRTSVTEMDVTRFDGSNLPLEVVATPVRTPAGHGWVVTLKSAAQEAADESLKSSEQRFRTLAERSPVATFFSGGGLRLEYVNDRFAELLECSAEEMLGTGWLLNLPPSSAESLAQVFERALQGEAVEDAIELYSEGRDSRWLLVRAEPVDYGRGGAGFVGTLEDITERARFEGRLARAARHDSLTGLPNRTALWEVLTELLPSARNDVALLFLDLDNFKVVNDSLGHDAGDQLLVEVARRLEGAVRAGDLITRFGGDEFVIVARGVSSPTSAARFAERVLEKVIEPLKLDGVEIHPGGSLGVALAQPFHRDPQELVRDADIAMYKAKNAGKNGWALCDDETRQQQQDRLVLLSDLRRSVERNELWLAYQPVVSLTEQKVVGVEALVRWRHPERGELRPDLFIPLAEEYNLVEMLGEHVLFESCQQMARWIEELGERAPQKVNVNVSAKQMKDRLVERVATALAESNLAPGRLCLEITETALMLDREQAKRCLGQLKEMGVQLAIDDFGTGQSSLSYLRELPVGYLKVDKSFVDEIGTKVEKAGVVAAAVIALAASLGLGVVAEGVEQAEQAEELVRMGCSHAQGYHFGRPVTATEISTILEEQ